MDTKPPSWKQSACLVISQHTATWTHTHSDTHSYTHNTHTHTQGHMGTQTWTHTHRNTHSYTQNTHTHTQGYGHPDMDTHTEKHTATPTIRTLTHGHLGTQTWTHIQRNAHSYTHGHTVTRLNGTAVTLHIQFESCCLFTHRSAMTAPCTLRSKVCVK